MRPEVVGCPQDEKALLENLLESARTTASNESKRTNEISGTIKDLRLKNNELEAQLARLKTARNKDTTELKTARLTADNLSKALDKARTEKDAQLAKAREEVSALQRCLSPAQTSTTSNVMKPVYGLFSRLFVAPCPTHVLGYPCGRCVVVVLWSIYVCWTCGSKWEQFLCMCVCVHPLDALNLLPV